MAWSSLFLTLLYLWSPLASSFPLACNPTAYLGCYNDTHRPVPILVTQSDPTMTLDRCSLYCAADGYPVFAVTAHPGFGYCYCGATLSPSASPVSDKQCSVVCPGNHSQSCGALGYSSAWRSTCDAPLPAPALGAGGPDQPFPACSSPASASWAFCNASLPRESRLDDLVQRIAVTEIGAQLTARQSPPIPRLGMPMFMWGTNAIHGITDYAECRAITGRCPTSWPNGVAMGATWNASAWRAMGAATGVELRAFDNLEWRANAVAGTGPVGGLVSWGPTVNIQREARWGRVGEAFSECVFLTSVAAMEVTRGLQEGEDARYLLAAATLKHAFAYSLEQWRDPVSGITFMRQTFDALVSPFDLGDTYTPAFQAAISQARAAGVMYAANSLNGAPCCTDSAVSDALLDSWVVPGAPFYRATDGGQIENAVAGHHKYPTLDAAIGAAAEAESDIADGSEFATRLTYALCNGNVSLGAVQRLLRNTLRIRMALGLFDDPKGQPYLSYGEAHIASGATNQSVAIAGREALVLLKNSNATLPFAPSAPSAPSPSPPSSSLASVAVIGPCADDLVVMGGGYLGPVCPNGPHGPSLTCHPSILGAITTTHAPDALYAPGGGYNDSSPTELAAAVAAVQGAARVVLCLGINNAFEGEQLDREEVGLPPSQLSLFAAVEGACAAGAAGGKPLAVVLIHGGPLSVPTIAASPWAGAILDAFQPGVVSGGEAVADALFGVFNPGGKLPYTIPYPNITSVVNMTSMVVGVSRTGPLPAGTVGRTYRYSREPPLYPFGWGLSYTNFSLAWVGPAPPPTNVTLTPTSPPFTLDLEVRNVGGVAGGEVVQLYFSPLPGTFGAGEPPFLPIRQLWGFQRSMVLQPGEAQAMSFNLTAQQLQLTQEGGTKAVLSGDFDVTVTRGHGDTLGFKVLVRV